MASVGILVQARQELPSGAFYRRCWRCWPTSATRPTFLPTFYLSALPEVESPQFCSPELVVASAPLRPTGSKPLPPPANGLIELAPLPLRQFDPSEVQTTISYAKAQQLACYSAGGPSFLCEN